MTPALQKMVEAMAAEIWRQSQENHAGAPWCGEIIVPTDVNIDGSVDLEKVARAGLKAIRTSTDAVVADAISGRPAIRSNSLRDWPRLIDAILKDEP